MIGSHNARPLPNPISNDHHSGILNQRFTFRKSHQNLPHDQNSIDHEHARHSNSLRRRKSQNSEERHTPLMSASRSPVRDTLGSLNHQVACGHRSTRAIGNGSEREAIHERQQSEMESLFARQLEEKERVVR